MNIIYRKELSGTAASRGYPTSIYMERVHGPKWFTAVNLACGPKPDHGPKGHSRSEASVQIAFSLIILHFRIICIEHTHFFNLI